MERVLRLCAARYSPEGWMHSSRDLHCAYVLSVQKAKAFGVEPFTPKEELPPELLEKVWQETAHLRKAPAANCDSGH